MYQKVSITIILIATLLFPYRLMADAPLDDELSQAMRLIPNLTWAMELFNDNCAKCHGEDGWGTSDGSIPQVAGQHSSVIIKQLADIRAGNRDNPRMYKYAIRSAIGGPQAIADIAAYLTRLPMNPEPEVGEGDDLDKAERLYKQKCASCHGDTGEGNASNYFPLIQGQHYHYLLRQLKWIRDGKRKNAFPAMMVIIKSMGDKQLQILADYVSRIVPPEEKLGKD